MSYRLTRIRRDALPTDMRAMLTIAKVGDRADVTFLGGDPYRATIIELTPEWVVFEANTTQ